MPRARKEKFDNRRRVDFTDTQADFLDSEADRLKMSFMGVVRRAVDEYMEGLSHQDNDINTPKTGQNRTQPNGLYTAEQVAELIKAALAKK